LNVEAGSPTAGAVTHGVTISDVTGGISNSLIAGRDINLVGEYVRLRDAKLDPGEVFRRVKLDRFAGRGWLLERVDHFLEGHDRGYFILEAKAGLGKTTLLAWLARNRGYIHHFAETAPGRDGIGRSLRNLAAQLILRYHLGTYEDEGVLPVVIEPNFLSRLLGEAADHCPAGEKIVLVIDALDEAGVPPEQNVLGLPRTLPASVYVIVSRRPVPVPLLVDEPKAVCELDAQGEANLADMRAYLEAAAGWPGAARALADTPHHPDGSPYGVDDFVDAVLAKSRGLWIYAHYVVEEIEHRQRNLEGLPEGVWEFYAQYWSRWRKHKIAWDADYLPLLSTLAAAREAIEWSQLCRLAGIAPRTELERLLREDWRPFLTVEDVVGGGREQRVYRFYHASVQEFLAGGFDLSELGEIHRDLAQELSDATRDAHARIADWYLRAWSGWETNLAGLEEPTTRDVDSGYGLGHLVEHLELARRTEDLHRLLALEQVSLLGSSVSPSPGWRRLLDRLFGRRPAEPLCHYQNVWHAAKEAAMDVDGYVADVQAAWRLAADVSLGAAHGPAAATAIPTSLGLQVRYALALSSLTSMVINIPPRLLAALVNKGVLLPEQVLAYARQESSSERRALWLALVADLLPDHLRGQALRVAIDIGDEINRRHALAGLAPHLTEPLLRQALAAIVAQDSEYARGKTLGVLAPHLSDSLRAEAVTAVEAISRPDYRASALGHLAPYVSETQLCAALEAVPELRDNDQSDTLARLAPHLPERLLARALELACGIKDEQQRAEALARLVIGPPEPPDGLAPHRPERFLGRALDAAGAVTNVGVRAKALIGMVPHLPERLLARALELACGIEDEQQRAEALAGVAAYLPEPLLRHSLDAARGIADEGGHAEALTGLLPRLAQLGFAEEALAAVSPKDRRADDVLAGMAPHLPEPLLQQALAKARKIGSRGSRAWTLARLVPHLAEPEREQVMRQAIRTASPPASVEYVSYRGEQPAVVSMLAPHLTDPLWRMALDVALAIKGDYRRVQTLVALAEHLPSQLCEEALAEAMASARRAGGEAQARMLEQLAWVLPAPLLREALTLARAIKSEAAQSRALADLLPHLEGSRQTAVVQEALVVARAVDDEQDRVSALGYLATRVPEPQDVDVSREALAAARQARDGNRAHALVDLLATLPRSLRAGAVSALLAVPRRSFGVDDEPEILAGLAPYRPDLPERALAAAKGAKQAGDRARLLAWIAPLLTAVEREDALRCALATTREIESALLASLTDSDAEKKKRNEDAKAEALERLAPLLSEPLVQEALDVARTLEDRGAAGRVRFALALQLAELGRAEDALEVIREHRSHFGAILPAARMLKYLQEPARSDLLQDLLRTVQWNPLWVRGEAVSVRVRLLLVPYLPEADRKVQVCEAARAAARLDDPNPAWERFKHGRSWARYWRTKEDEWPRRAQVLAEVGQILRELPFEDLHALWLEILPLLSKRDRPKLLVDLGGLALVIATLGGTAAVAETVRAIRQTSRWWP
jgi:hypothetical protein